jgi:PepSY-associated TM region
VLAMNLLRKLIIFSHRYLGMAISLLVVVWFASGILMIYSGGMPIITPQERLEHLYPLQIAKVQLRPSQAAERAGFAVEFGFDGRVTLHAVMDRPAYRFGTDTTVFADTGEMMEALTPEQSRAVAGRYLRLPEEKVGAAGTLMQVDQWTLGTGRQMPLYKFAADDGLGTELYIQPKTAEVAMLTTTRSRALAWVSTIPHWLYFTSLRAKQPLWYQIMVWTSALACVLAVLGLILSVTQFKRTKPFRLAAAIPYSGWLRWHYITGAVFGLFTLTWAFSGLLSMEPFEWTRAEGLEAPRDALTGGPLDLAQFAAMDTATWDRLLAGRAVKEVELARMQGDPYYVVRTVPDERAAARERERLHQPYNVAGQAEPDRLLVSAWTLEPRHAPFSVESLVSRLRTALPEAPIVEQQLLQDYDSYYYSRGRQAPLPVLRVKFGDSAQTWLYIDPEMSRVVATVHRLSRVERWLYSGLHDLDFSFWYDRRPLWDIGVITLCLGGLASSSIGLFLGIKRLLRLIGRRVLASMCH